MKVINYELRIEIEGTAENEMASRGIGAGEILRKWEQSIRNMKFGTGAASGRVTLFEEVSSK